MSAHPDAKRYEAGAARDEKERLDLLAHARDCAECRSHLAQADPSRLFAELALRPIPGAALERLSGRVERALSADESARSPWYGYRVVASIAASLLLAGVFGIYMTGRSLPSPSLVPGAGFPGPARADAMAAPALPAAGIQLISSPGEAKVMELAVGETRVVMIFDEALDL